MRTPEELAYTESVRALEQQARKVDELRGRTGVLLTGASIVASFLGAQVLARTDFDTLAGLALVAFAAVMGLSLSILWPYHGWEWSAGSKKILEGWAIPERREDIPAMYGFLAERMEESWECNKKLLDKLFVCYQVALAGLGAEVVFWTLKLA